MYTCAVNKEDKMKKELVAEVKQEIKEELAKEIHDSVTEKLKKDMGVESVSSESVRENATAKFFDKRVEPLMWHVKFTAFIAVAVSLLVSIILMLYGAYETLHLVAALWHKAPAQEIQLLTLGVVDMFLFGMVMMIFSFGSYNLFISKIDNVGRDMRTLEIRPKWVQVENFGELKAIFIKVVVMILIINFLELVVTNTELFKEDIYSLLIIPVGIVLIAYSLKLLHSREEHK